MDEQSAKHQVIVVEDDPVCADELSRLVSDSDTFALAGCAMSFAAGLALLREPHDVMIVDVGLPDGSGIDLVRKQAEVAPHAKSLVMTVFDDRDTTSAALAAGADGYVLKTDPHLVSHLELLMADQHPIDPGVAGYLLAAVRSETMQDPAPLTPREQQTLEGLSRGMSYREIAEHLNVSPHTVTDYIKGVYRKLEVNSRSEAVYAGVRRGLVSFG